MLSKYVVQNVQNTNKPLILSTGMSDLGIVEDAVNTFKKTGNQNLILLHCLSSYPADEKEMNLKVKIVLDRVENKEKEKYDIITSRALANLSKLFTYSHNFIKEILHRC